MQVVDYLTSQTSVPSTAILQPVTLTSATLTFTRSCVATVVEKLVLFGAAGRAKPESETLVSFKERTINRLMKELPDVKDRVTCECRGGR